MPDGHALVLVGQKSGSVYALDPDAAGAIRWRSEVGGGGNAGGIQWGMSADHHAVYAASNTWGVETAEPAGLSAFELSTGRRLWRTPVPAPVCDWGTRNCLRGQPQAVTAVSGVVFEGALDGHLRAYSAADGTILWDFDTAKEFRTVNGIMATGGSLDHGGAVVVDGMLYINSGYGRIAGQPGNVLLAFSVDGR